MEKTSKRVLAGDYIDAYLARCRVENKTEQTIESYEKTLRLWQRSGRDPEAWLNNLACGKITKHKHFRQLRVYFRWLVDRGILDASPLAGLKMRLPKWLPKRAETGEIRAMLSAVESIRDRLMFIITADSGTRRIEVARLRIEDVDLSGRLLRLRGKGDKDRMVPFGPDTARLLRNWITSRYANGAHQEDPLFPNIKTGEFLSVHTISHIFQRSARIAGIKARGPHSFRHWSASRLLEKTGNLELVRNFLGHETLATTLLYVKMLGLQVREKYRSPAEDLL